MRKSLVVLALALAATACDSGSTTTGEPTPAPTVTVTATETVTEAPVELLDPCDALVGGDAMAFVFVTSPPPGTMVSSGFSFSGCSNTFEAAYVWELLAADNTQLASGFGTATCGTGCVGTLSQPVTFTVSTQQVGTLRVFTESAEDGSEQDLNSIPLVLMP